MDMFMILFYKRLRNKLPSSGNSPTQTVIKDGIVSGNIQYDKITGIVSGKMKTEDGILIL